MKTPDLPLRDIHLPEPVSWWPLAPGWWLCIALLVALGAALAWWWHGAPLRRVRQAALAELGAIDAGYGRNADGHACAQSLSRLLRRLALLAGDAQAAHLNGAALLAVLNGLGRTPLPEEIITLLDTAPYSPRAAAAIDAARFRDATRDLERWLRHLRVPRDRLLMLRHAAV